MVYDIYISNISIYPLQYVFTVDIQCREKLEWELDYRKIPVRL